ncbi:MAG: helix-turn-helix domain-containing protein [Candidatus Thermoplasmatota archaeon]
MDTEQSLLHLAGLTEYEARAYRTLLGLGSVGAADIAEASGIPRTRIYAVLDGLLERWVIVEAGRPKRYRARDPHECFEDARRELDAKIEAGLPILAARYHEREQRFAGPLWILEGEPAIVKRAVAIAQRARKSLRFVLPVPMRPPPSLTEAIGRAQKRGVVLLIGASAEAGREFARKGLTSREMRFPAFVLVSDETQGLLAVRTEGGAMRGLWNPNPELARFMVALLRPVLDGA